jgi:hypothetical protein
MLSIPVYRGKNGLSLVRMKPEHVMWLKLKEPELTYERDMPDMRKYITETADYNRSWSATDRGKVFLCFGIRPAWTGVGEAWLLPGNNISDHAISVTRYARNLFTELLQNGEYARIHIAVRADNDIALKFAKALGFEVEGVMRNFGPDGVDSYMMARISDNGRSKKSVESVPGSTPSSTSAGS